VETAAGGGAWRPFLDRVASDCPRLKCLRETHWSPARSAPERPNGSNRPTSGKINGLGEQEIIGTGTNPGRNARRCDLTAPGRSLGKKEKGGKVTSRQSGDKSASLLPSPSAQRLVD